MESQIIEIGLTEWQVEYPNQDWITALEAGKVLYFPQLAFQLMDSERKLLDPAVRAPKSRNISLDARGHIKGAAGGTEQQLALAAMIGRFREQSLSLVHTLLPKYRDALRIAPTSNRTLTLVLRGPITANASCASLPM
jgi:hypothetical protein